MADLQKILDSLWSNQINRSFAIVMIAIAVFALVFARIDRPGQQAFSRATPGVLTSIGVLGTFVGILLGLLDFDVTKVEEAVPRLLEGMKVAFATSVAGMSLGVTVKLATTWIRPSDRVMSANPVEILARLQQDARGHHERIETSLERIRGGLAGDGDSSVVTQIQRLRTTVSDESRDTRERLIAELQAFGRLLAENNAKMFLEALRDAIRDFNQKLTEQFGENFRHLNMAVGNLLTWQTEHKSHVETLTQRFETIVGTTERLQLAIGQISEKSAAIAGAAKALEQLLAGFERSQSDLERKLEAFSELGRSAGQALPQIQTRLDEVVTAARDMATSQKTAYTTLSTNYGTLKAQVEEAAKQMEAGARRAFETTNQAVQALGQQLSQQMQASAQQSRDIFKKALEESAQTLSGQIKVLDESMQEELKKSLERMGSALASLSNKFVSDYGPLTERLREVVQLANSVGR